MTRYIINFDALLKMLLGITVLMVIESQKFFYLLDVEQGDAGVL